MTGSRPYLENKIVLSKHLHNICFIIECNPRCTDRLCIGVDFLPKGDLLYLLVNISASTEFLLSKHNGNLTS